MNIITNKCDVFCFSYTRNVMHLHCPLLMRGVPFYELEFQMVGTHSHLFRHYALWEHLFLTNHPLAFLGMFISFVAFKLKTRNDQCQDCLLFKL